MKSGWSCNKQLSARSATDHLGRTLLALILAGVSVCACQIASDPESLKPEYVSPDRYENFECTELAKRIVALGYQIEDLQSRLSKRHDRDQWQLAFSWFYGVSAAFIDGDGADAQRFRHLQGEFEAARIQAIRKDCGFEAPTREEVYLKAKASLS